MKFALCDDQISHAEVTRKLIDEYMFKNNIECACELYSSADKLVDNLERTKYDVIFLDVQMPEINGMELAAKIKHITPDCEIVFISAFLNFATEGYRVNAVRYILKQDIQYLLIECLDLLVEKHKEKSNFIQLSVGGLLKKLCLTDILYFKANEHYVNIFYCDDRKRNELLTISIHNIEKELKDKGFLRIHKSYLVNMFHVININNYLATLSNGVTLKLSEKRYSELKRVFILWKGSQL